LLFSASEVEERRHGLFNVIAEAFRYGRRLEPGEALHGAGLDTQRFSAHCPARPLRGQGHG